MKRYSTSTKTKKDEEALYLAYEQYLAQLKIEEEVRNTRLKNARDTKMLAFSSKEEAYNFLEERAELNVSFTAFGYDESGKLTGDYYFSNGDGSFTEGKFSPETMKELCNKLLKNPSIGLNLSNALKNGNEDDVKKILKSEQTKESSVSISPEVNDDHRPSSP